MLVGAAGLEPANLLGVSEALSQLSYAPQLVPPVLIPAPCLFSRNGPPERAETHYKYNGRTLALSNI